MADSSWLFEQNVPPGFQYRDDFITSAEELGLLDGMADIAFSDFEMRGVVARRRVAFFGQIGRSENREADSRIVVPLRAKVAEWAGIASEAFAMVLINEYRPGTPIGWHRDAPDMILSPGNLAALSVPDTVPPLPVARLDGADVLPIANTPDRALASFGVPHDAGIAQRIRASHSAGRELALLDHVPDAAVIRNLCGALGGRNSRGTTGSFGLRVRRD